MAGYFHKLERLLDMVDDVKAETIDELLSKHANLMAAVMILIDSAKKNNDRDALYRWDQARKE